MEQSVQFGLRIWVYLIYGMDYGMERWNGLMEYQLTKCMYTSVLCVICKFTFHLT